MKYHTRVRAEILAKQWAEDNTDDIVQWCNGEFDGTAIHVGGWMLPPNHWLVFTPDGEFSVYTDPEFKKTFVPIPDLIRTVADYEALPDGTILEVVTNPDPADYYFSPGEVMVKRRGRFLVETGQSGAVWTDVDSMLCRPVCSVVRLGGSNE